MSCDIRQTADGRQLLDEAKEKREKPTSAVPGPKKYGPNTCSVCVGFCCGKGHVRPSTGKGAAKEPCSKKYPATTDSTMTPAQVAEVEFVFWFFIIPYLTPLQLFLIR